MSGARNIELRGTWRSAREIVGIADLKITSPKRSARHQSGWEGFFPVLRRIPPEIRRAHSHLRQPPDERAYI